MNSEPQRFVERLEAGTIELDDPELLEAADRWPELKEWIEEMHGVERQLDEWHAEAGVVIAAARAAQPSASDEAQVTSAMGSTHQPQRWRTVLVAAALLLIAVTGWWVLSPERSRQDPVHPGPALGGSGRLEALAPKGESDALEEFRWTHLAGEGDWYVVRIRDLDSGREISSPELSDTNWHCDEMDEVERLEWYVQCFRGSSSDFVNSPPVRASRRR